MTTVVRVKRHLQDDPVEAVRLQCKRQRTEEAERSASFEKVLNFVGTVEKKEDYVSQRTLGTPSAYVNRLKQLKSDRPSILSKMRAENKARSEENRFKILSCMRSSSGGDQLESSSQDNPPDVTIVDVKSQKKNEGGDRDISSEDDEYVYDLYSTTLDDEYYNDVFLDNVVGVEPYTSGFVYGTHYRDPQPEDDDYFDPDEDDSNDENNWRNSYQDEQDSDSEEIDVLTNNFRKLCGDMSHELSDDEGEEDYLNYYDKYCKKDYFYQEAKNLAGSSYAKYKMNILHEEDNDDAN